MSKRNKFPQTEAGIMTLAQEMASGFEKNGGVYPAPPVKPSDLKTRIAAVQERLNDVVEAEAQRKAKINAKDAELDLLEEEMKESLQYAEFVTKGDDAQLKLIGWSGRAAPKPLVAPAQPRAFEVIGQGAGWVKFDWKEPKDSSAVAVYKVLRRTLKEGGDMREAGSSVISEITLVDQPRGVELDYVVIAVNKAGNSDSSNPITIVL